MPPKTRRGNPPRQTKSVYARNNDNLQEPQEVNTMDNSIESNQNDYIQQKIDTLLAEAIAKAVPQITGKSGQTTTQTPELLDHTDSQLDKSELSVQTDKPKGKKHNKRKRSQTRRKHASKTKRSRQKSRRSNDTSDEDSSTTDTSGTDSETSDSEFDYDGLPSEDESTPDRPCFGYPVGESIPRKLKKKILKDEFIELSQLLPQSEKHPKNDKIILVPASNGQLDLARPSSQKWLPIEQWNEAFLIYMSIYVQRAKKSPKQAHKLTQQLLTYYRDINKMAKKNWLWRDYDRRFRRDKVNCPITFSTIRQDLMLDAQMKHTDTPKTFTKNPQLFRNKFTPKNKQQSQYQNTTQGYCNTFNSPERRCTNISCRFKHTCYKCAGAHPAFLCRTNQQYPPTTTTPITAPPANRQLAIQPKQHIAPGQSKTGN